MRPVRWRGLDGVRGIAALAVVFFHAGFGPAVNGYAGVDVFFALSGFLITSLLLRERTRSGRIALGRFYIRRLLRLYPALVALCVGVMVIAIVTSKAGAEVGAAAAALLYVANWWIYLGHPAPLLEHTWTLAIEEHFYALWPVALLLLLGRERRRRVFGWVIAGAVCVFIALPWPSGIDSVRESYVRGVPIVWGSLLAVLLQRWSLPRRAGRVVLALGSVLLLVLLGMPTRLDQGFVTGPFGAAGVLSVLVVAAVVSSSDGRGGLWGSRPLVWLGRRSYGLYLYHFPILSLFAHQLSVGASWQRRLVALVVVVAVTGASYRFLESPFLALKDRRFAGSGALRRRRPGRHRPAAGQHSSPPEMLDRRELQDRALRGASWTMIHTVTAVPIAFLVNLLLARLLGVVHFGRLAFLMTLMDVVSGIVALGVTTGTIQFGAKAHAAGRRDEVCSLLSKAQGFRILVAAPVLTVVVILVAQVSTPMLLLALVFGVWVPGFLDGATTCLGIENRTATGAKISMFANLVLQAGVAVSVVVSRQADVVWVTRLILGAVGVGVALLVINPAYRAAVLRPSLPRGMPSGFWRFAIPTAVAGLVSTLVLSRTEVFFLTWLGDAAAVGLFALAFGLASHIFSPAQALVGPLMPAVSGLHEVDAGAVGRAFRRTIRTSSLLVAVICVLGVPAFALLIPVLYGSAYERSAPMFVALSISAGLLIASGPVSAFVMGRLAARTMLEVSLIALAVDVGFAVVLIPALGGWGAVLANVGGAVTLLVLLVRAELRTLGMSWGELLRQLRSLGVALPICMLVWWTIGSVGLPVSAGVALSIIMGVALWVLMVRLVHGGVTDQDATALLRVVPVRVRRRARLMLSAVTTSDGAA